MKILHIVCREVSGDAQNVIDEQRKTHQVEVIDLDAVQADYTLVMQKIVDSDRVISWSNIHETAATTA